MTKTRLLSPGECCLHIVDPQASLMKKIPDAARVTRVIKLMVACAKILGIPILANIQYKKGLGPYVSELDDVVEGFDIIDKKEFGAMANKATLAAVQALPEEIKTHILVGVETHICIYQTAMGLVAAGRRPWLVADGVAARSGENHELALTRMRGLGMDIGPAEMIIYELLGKAGTPEFKEVLPHIIAFSKENGE